MHFFLIICEIDRWESLFIFKKKTKIISVLRIAKKICFLRELIDGAVREREGERICNGMSVSYMKHSKVLNGMYLSTVQMKDNDFHTWWKKQSPFPCVSYVYTLYWSKQTILLQHISYAN